MLYDYFRFRDYRQNHRSGTSSFIEMSCFKMFYNLVIQQLRDIELIVNIIF